MIAIAAVGVVTIVLIVFGMIVELGELPRCDSKSAKDMLSTVFIQKKVNPAKYNEIKALSKTDEEIKCTASLALRAGGNIEVDYRFYWENKEKKYEVTRLQPQP